MKVIEIFKSIDGEGVRAGIPATFIRLEGCNLRCSFCDTKYSYENAKYTEMTPKEILHEVRQLGVKRVTLTGGEPLIHENIVELVSLLLCDGMEVNIETNGAVNLNEFHDKLYKGRPVDFSDTIMQGILIYTVDYKCYESGMNDYMIEQNLEFLNSSKGNFKVLKFVVGSQRDLELMKHVVTTNSLSRANVFVSPVFGMIEPKEIVEYILNNPELESVRIQLQMHKIIWDPEMRGV